ncbi:MAG TPA: hypothetical protein VFH29_02625 [Anaerolineales bacterium]|nr:hypothetical protein [Anaerolineales bacterium]
MKILRSLATSLVVLLAFSAGCAPVPPSPEAPAPPTSTSTELVPLAITLSVPATDTPTAGAFLLDLTPLPSATALPTLILPPSPSVPLDIQVWDGLPTYPAESQPDFYFRLRYDPAYWARTIDALGSQILASRTVNECVIKPMAGRGLPLNGNVDHGVRIVGDIDYDISRVSVGGMLQFVTYAGGDARIFTAFEVHFTGQSDVCLPAAETVLGTLRSVPLSEATQVAP